MRKDFAGIFLFFLAVFTLISLLSYTPSDPSGHHARSQDDIHNFFGLPGAYISGSLTELFGFSAFCIPALLVFSCIRFMGNDHRTAVFRGVAGAILLIIATGTLLAFRQDYCLIFGHTVTAGGVVGMLLKAYLISVSNVTIGVIMLIFMWMFAFLLVTGLSMMPLISVFNCCGQMFTRGMKRAATLFIIRKEQRRRAKKRLQAAKENAGDALENDIYDKNEISE
ncbi:DNA translocase FtsK 4TM domain-containing protein [Desulfonema magnum]|uniref:DNA translocase domain-containing protein n=1 Tax=Desulfonema magnum TaxID=45655 RepID=A0A975BH85_9BACT|nr:DNA translocase FtsK 4TM domain-containing protein [Desulfonema magnum]QTA85235.1 DNA translocase domain-containing protein [Desulfonema magnum]